MSWCESLDVDDSYSQDEYGLLSVTWWLIEVIICIVVHE